MTIKQTIECDAWCCLNSIEVDECDSPDITMQYSGWKQDPYNGWNQYCPSCWPTVKKELEKENEEDLTNW